MLFTPPVDLKFPISLQLPTWAPPFSLSIIFSTSYSLQLSTILWGPIRLTFPSIETLCIICWSANNPKVPQEVFTQRSQRRVVHFLSDLCPHRDCGKSEEHWPRWNLMPKLLNEPAIVHLFVQSFEGWRLKGLRTDPIVPGSARVHWNCFVMSETQKINR